MATFSAASKTTTTAILLGSNRRSLPATSFCLAAALWSVDPTTGQGTLTLTTNNPNVGVGGYETLAVQFVNANHALIIQFDGSATSSGSMDLQTLSSALNDGNYAFTLTGEDPGYYSIVLGGVFSISIRWHRLVGHFRRR